LKSAAPALPAPATAMAGRPTLRISPGADAFIKGPIGGAPG